MRTFPLFLTLLPALLPLLAPPQELAMPELGFDHEHKAWTEVLERFASGNRFDYQGLVEDRGRLDQYLAMVSAVTREEHDGWTREQQFAFWINVYNAHVVHLVAKHYPLESIEEIGSLLSPVWKKEFIALSELHPEGGLDMLSLDDVEHGILRPRFGDARVHAAVNCASLGCPPLRPDAYVAERLDEQLDQQARAWLADPAYTRYDRERSTVHVSAIFDWFEEDFERDAGSLREWLERFAPPGEAEWMRAAEKLRIRHLDYDWSLNDVERERR